MSKTLELYKTATIKSDEHKLKMKEAMTAMQKSREAWKQLVEMHSGKSREQIVEVWDAELAEFMREYCKTLKNANEKIAYGSKMRKVPRHTKTYAARRDYFIERMMGKRLERSTQIKPEFCQPEHLIRYTLRYAELMSDKVTEMTPLQRKTLLEKVIKPLAHALHPYKDELKQTRLECFCGCKDTSYNGIDCSQQCQHDREAYERHKAGEDVWQKIA